MIGCTSRFCEKIAIFTRFIVLPVVEILTSSASVLPQLKGVNYSIIPEVQVCTSEEFSYRSMLIGETGVPGKRMAALSTYEA